MLSDDMRAGDSVTVVIRPEEIHLVADGAADGSGGAGDNVIEGEPTE